MKPWTIRQKSAGMGAATGLLLTAFMARVTPERRVLYGLKCHFWEGVTYGIGGALGIIWSVGLMHRIGDVFEERHLREEAESTPGARSFSGQGE